MLTWKRKRRIEHRAEEGSGAARGHEDACSPEYVGPGGEGEDVGDGCQQIPRRDPVIEGEDGGAAQEGERGVRTQIERAGSTDVENKRWKGRHSEPDVAVQGPNWSLKAYSEIELVDAGFARKTTENDIGKSPESPDHLQNPAKWKRKIIDRLEATTPPELVAFGLIDQNKDSENPERAWEDKRGEDIDHH